MKFKAIFNRDGGTFRTTDLEAYSAEARRVFREAGHGLDVTVVAGSEVIDALKDASNSDRHDGIVAGGGDGTISAAAGMAWRAGRPLGVIPAGTMNLFARSLRLPLDIRAALPVIASGVTRDCDIGTVDGRAFVHQFSAGMHARMVRMRNGMDYASRAGKMLASVRASLGVLVDPPRFVVESIIDGQREEREVSAISVSNNPFGANSLMYQDALDGGELGVYLASALGPGGATRLALDILRGRIRDNADITEIRTTAIDLHFPRLHHRANYVLDGELLRLGRDVSIRLHPGELKVLAPVDQK